MPRIRKDPKTGIQHVYFRGPNGRTSRSTKTKDLKEARRIVAEAGIADLERAAKSRSLTAETVQAIVAGRKLSVATALDEWRQWREAEAAPNTVATHLAYLRRWFSDLRAEKWPLTKLTRDHINAFVNTSDETKVSTRNARLAAARSFFRYCSANSYILGNPAALVQVRTRDLTHAQKESRPRVPFTDREFRHIMAHTEGFWRWATALSYWTGMRLSDVCCLEWASIMPSEIVVHTRKDSDRIALPLGHELLGGNELVAVLFDILQHREHNKWCFPRERAELIDVRSRSKFSVYYGRILERLGIEGKSFHCLRHAFATRLADAGTSIEQIGRYLGHSDEDTTKGYVHIQTAPKISGPQP